MKPTKLFSIIAVALACALPPLHAATVNVSTTGMDTNPATCGGGFCCGPANTPCRTIEGGYLHAVDGDTILVAPGTYIECINAFESLGDKAVDIVASAWQDNSDNTATTISGTPCQTGPNKNSVISLGSIAGSKLEGFTVINGGVSGISGFGSVTITNNVIRQNTSIEGGGIYTYSTSCFWGDTTAFITDNLIENNEAVWDPTATGGGDDLGSGGRGGGIFISAVGVVPEVGSSCIEGRPTVNVSGNTIRNNSVSGNPTDRSVFAGGLGVQTNSGVSTLGGLGLATVTITDNTISSNEIAQFSDGFGAGAWISTYGFGAETIEFRDNTVAANTARGSGSFTGDGGGVSAWVQTLGIHGDPGFPETRTQHTILIQDNTVINNTAQGNGGGLDLFIVADDLAGQEITELTVEDNFIAANISQGTQGGGGGLLATLFSRRSRALMAFNIRDNVISNNTATTSGGGMSALVTADADPPDDPGFPQRTRPAITFTRNLVTLNTAGTGGGSAVGGALFAFAQAFGDARARVVVDLSTFADNTADVGAGGIEFEELSDFDFASVELGQTQLIVINSILSENSGFGIGGPLPTTGGTVAPPGGQGNATLVIAFSDVFGHPAGNYESWVGDRTGEVFGNISADAMLSANFYMPAACAPTLDLADVGVDFSAEPPPNGGRANMGYLGGTSGATKSLADVSGDGFVDGVDVLQISVAFDSAVGQPRFMPQLDFDGDDDIDGDDLAVLAADFAVACP